MPSYKLIYFNMRGGGEVVRFVFAQTGVKYEDFRVAADTNGDQWREMKPSTPFGVLPVLEIDGKQLGGSKVIARYLAEQFGLAGENTFEIANIADAVQALNDEMIKVWFEKDEARKAEMLKKLEEEIIPGKLPFFERRASTNESGWLARKLTWADFFYLSLEWVLKMTNEKVLNDSLG